MTSDPPGLRLGLVALVGTILAVFAWSGAGL